MRARQHKQYAIIRKGCNDDDAVLSLNMFGFASVSSALHLELQFSGNKSGKHQIIQLQCLEQSLSSVKLKSVNATANFLNPINRQMLHVHTTIFAETILVPNNLAC